VAVAGEIEGAGERLAVDLGRRVELLDYGEEIGEELLLLYGLLRRSRYRVPSW